MLPRVEDTLVVVFAGFALAGVLAGKWVIAVLPLLVWPPFYLGLHEGWWGSGVGDGWQYAAAIVVSLSIVATLVGVTIGRTVRARAAGRALERR
jgi:hypothetical protein